MREGAFVWVQVRGQCEGEGTLHWRTHATPVTCPFDVMGFDVHPPQLVFETTRPQHIVAHADIVEVHGVPKLEHWTPL